MFGTTKKTVASVMTVFNKTITDLEQVETDQKLEAQRQAQIVEEARAAKAAADAEAASAREIADKLAALVRTTITPQGQLAAEAQ